MHIPAPPTPKHVDRISPSLYETLLGCPARACSYVSGQLDALPVHPSALLGRCFHGVMEAAQKGEIVGDERECRDAARGYFDKMAATLHAGAQPLLRAKFASPEKLPFYNLFRERAAVLAVDCCIRRSDLESSEGDSAVAERRFTSADGVIAGRADLIDVGRSEVIDYKTGTASKDGWLVSEREARQLRLYAYLAGEGGVSISRGTIVRADGETATIDIEATAAAAEADYARATLQAFNEAASDGTFSEIAQPAADVCRMCPCVPLCESFWHAANPAWQEDCGVHIEGTVLDVEQTLVQGVALVSMRVDVSRGTVEQAVVAVEQVPLAWVTADGDRVPEVGDIVRVVEGRMISTDDQPVIRADRVMTAVWRVGVGDG